jgi:TetR/AcrR family transcriptional repressor of nem operon
MGRKCEFDQARALEKATHLFWAKGYGATSVRNLLKVMGIRESSFYHLFSSKRKLYLACMKHYNDTVTRARLNVINNTPTVREGLRTFFKQRLDELTDPKTPHVCLMARSLSPEVMEERQLDAYVRTEMCSFEQALIRRLQQAKDNGELPSDFSAGLAAQILFTYLQGYYRVVHVLKSREQLWREIESLLTKLGL